MVPKLFELNEDEVDDDLKKEADSARKSKKTDLINIQKSAIVIREKVI